MSTLLTRQSVETAFRASLSCFCGDIPAGRPEDRRAATLEHLANLYGAGNVAAVLETTRRWLAGDPKVNRLLFLSGLGNRAEVVLPLCRAAMEAVTT